MGLDQPLKMQVSAYTFQYVQKSILTVYNVVSVGIYIFDAFY